MFSKMSLKKLEILYYILAGIVLILVCFGIYTKSVIIGIFLLHGLLLYTILHHIYFKKMDKEEFPEIFD